MSACASGCRPLPPDELSSIIHEACGDDNSTAMLTQVCDLCYIYSYFTAMFKFNSVLFNPINLEAWLNGIYIVGPVSIIIIMC